MLRVILNVTAAALLGGCAVSSLSDAGVGNNIGEAVSTEQGVTGSVTPAATGAAATGANVAPISTLPRNKASSETRTVDASQQTSARASIAAISTVSTPGSQAYKIGPQDVIEIAVFKVAELSRTAQVSEAGTINFPLVGEVAAAGKTSRQLEIELTTLLGDKYLRKPQVAVIIKEFNSQRLTVEGAVRKPGVFPMQGSVSLLQAVAMAQGLDTLADNTVVVVRTSDGKRAAARFDLGGIRDGTTQDPQLQPGDILIAGTSSIKEGLNFLKSLPLTSAFALL